MTDVLVFLAVVGGLLLISVIISVVVFSWCHYPEGLIKHYRKKRKERKK